MRRDNPNASKPPDLEGHDESPPWFPWVWEWFFDFQPGITWMEINAWSERTQNNPCGWECRLLIDLDRARR